MRFKGDIIITDPCYILKDNDWDKYLVHEDLSIFGLNTCIARDTIYGDWSCTTFDMNTGAVLGEFCADAGLVGVFLLDEVLKYNPGFDCHITKPWTTTLIRHFDGEVDFEIVQTETVCEKDTSWCKKGDKIISDEVHVVGKGNINFVGLQTGI